MLSENDGQATDTLPTPDNGAPLILTTPPLVKNPSEEAIISKNLESLDLASSTTTRDYTQALTKILSAPGNPKDGEKKGSKVKSMFMVLSPFKVKNEQSPILGRAPSPTPPATEQQVQQETSTVARNKKDCSITLKGVHVILTSLTLARLHHISFILLILMIITSVFLHHS